MKKNSPLRAAVSPRRHRTISRHVLCALAAALCAVAHADEAIDAPAPSVPVQSVTVTAARGSRLQDLDVSTTVLRREQIEKSPETTAEQIVNRIPGVFALNQPSGQLHPTSQVFNIRGFGTTTNVNTLLMVDGVPANDPYFRTIDWRQIPKDSIERIEVIRGGGASSLWGNLAMGGIVNIVTRDPGETARQVSLSAGSFGTWSVDGNTPLYAGEQLHVGLAVGTTHSGGYQQTPADYLNPGMSKTASRSDDLLLSATLSPSGDSRYYAKLSAHQAKEDGLIWSPAHNAWDAYKLTAGATVRLAQATSVNANVWIGRSEMDTTNSGQSPAYSNANPTAAVPYVSQIEAARYSHLGGSAFVQTRQGPVSDIKLGVDLRQVRADDDLNLFNTSAQTAAIVARGEHRFEGLFAQGTWQADGLPLEVTVGLRQDFWQARDASVDGAILANGATLSVPVADASVSRFDPRVGLKLRVADGWSMRAAAYRNFAAPGMNQMYRSFVSGTSYTATSPGLQPQTNVGKEIGLDWARPGMSLAFTAYDNRLANFIDYAPLCTTAAACVPLIAGTGLAAGSITRVNQYVNAGQATLRGFELLGQWVLTPALTLDGGVIRTSAFLTRSNYTTPSTTPPDPVNKQLGQVPLWGFNLGAQWQALPELAVSVQAKAFPPYWNNTAHTQRNEGAALLDIGATYALGKDLTLWASIQNLGDDRYFDQGLTYTSIEGSTVAGSSIPALGAPRSVMLGLRLAF